ncbi:phage tail protein [Victivallis sp. Marseille-Q1083]|uniref:phage tail protein n=1 Tax=Victivallis sp. Marseille-Q1083 TaxID=2717288 RepID=UPI00158CCD35|nr:phage tail protein [Victivallis sp. Marseille-Q1083]
MIRNRFDELRKYLKTKLTLLGIRPEQFDAWIDKLALPEGGHNETEDGYHLCNFRYTGRIYIERLPEAQLSLLALYVRSWLDDNDDTRGAYKLPDPEAEIIPLDDDTLIDVLLPVEFVDPVYLAPAGDDDPEALDWCGRKWSVAEYLVDYAERGTVNQAPTESEE